MVGWDFKSTLKYLKRSKHERETKQEMLRKSKFFKQNPKLLLCNKDRQQKKDTENHRIRTCMFSVG